jgi:hypothetical protein
LALKPKFSSTFFPLSSSVPLKTTNVCGYRPKKTEPLKLWNSTYTLADAGWAKATSTRSESSRRSRKVETVREIIAQR